MDARLQDVSLVSATTPSGYGKSLPSVARGAHRLTENYSAPARHVLRASVPAMWRSGDCDLETN